jgi:16S rRNA (guanine527-N7)-methyltransferase
MDSPDIIYKYFPALNEYQKNAIDSLGNIYIEWNSRINVISRNDMAFFYERHVLHSLSIALAFPFEADRMIVDIGTGGGFPGIPLAILFPENQFLLVDSIGKKIKVVDAVVQNLGLTNVKTINGRVELIGIKTDYVISRATAPMPDLVKWSMPILRNKNGNGLIALKGGDLSAELMGYKNLISKNISDFFVEPFFETKKVLFMPA